MNAALGLAPLGSLKSVTCIDRFVFNPGVGLHLFRSNVVNNNPNARKLINTTAAVEKRDVLEAEDVAEGEEADGSGFAVEGQESTEPEESDAQPGYPLFVPVGNPKFGLATQFPVDPQKEHRASVKQVAQV